MRIMHSDSVWEKKMKKRKTQHSEKQRLKGYAFIYLWIYPSIARKRWSRNNELTEKSTEVYHSYKEKYRT